MIITNTKGALQTKNYLFITNRYRKRKHNDTDNATYLHSRRNQFTLGMQTHQMSGAEICIDIGQNERGADDNHRSELNQLIQIHGRNGWTRRQMRSTNGFKIGRRTIPVAEDTLRPGDKRITPSIVMAVIAELQQNETQIQGERAKHHTAQNHFVLQAAEQFTLREIGGTDRVF